MTTHAPTTHAPTTHAPTTQSADDFESRPGSAASLLRTFVGLYLRDLGGWLGVRSFITFMAVLDIPEKQTRTTLSRVKQRGLLRSEQRGGVAGYGLTDEARTALRLGDRRIHHPRSMAPGDPWCLISFTVPEAERDRRHQLRRRLQGIGCGTVGPALWICSDFLRGEVEEILRQLDLRASATLFVCDRAVVAGDLADAAARWWDLDAIAERHRAFLAGARALANGPGTTARADQSDRADRADRADRESFRRYVRLVDMWRLIPYLDPGLPATLLPADWPGQESARVFTAQRAAHADRSAAFVRATAC